jgi:hypothetical protein
LASIYCSVYQNIKHPGATKKRTKSAWQWQRYVSLCCADDERVSLMFFCSFFCVFPEKANLPKTKKRAHPKPSKNVKPPKKTTRATRTKKIKDDNKDQDDGKENKQSEAIEIDVNDSDESKDDANCDPKKRSHAQNYLGHKDLQICTSWLETTKDGRKGTNQSGDVFWETVCKQYQKHIPKPKRTSKSLKNWWGLIQHSVNKYHGCVQQINHFNPSGSNTNNQVKMALSLYSKTQGKAFTFMSCYKLLAKSAKFFKYNAFLKKKNKQNKTIKSRDYSPPPSSRPVTTQATSDALGNKTSVPPTCPIGCKKAKIEYQEQQLEISNHKQIKKIFSAHCEIAEAAKKQQATLNSQNANLQRLSNNAIMNKDLTGVSKMVRKYYELKQKKIIACLEGELGQQE